MFSLGSSTQRMGTVKGVQYERSIACRKLCASIASLLLYLERQLCEHKDIPLKSSGDGVMDDVAASWDSIPHFWMTSLTKIIFCIRCRIPLLNFSLQLFICYPQSSLFAVGRNGIFLGCAQSSSRLVKKNPRALHSSKVGVWLVRTNEGVTFTILWGLDDSLMTGGTELEAYYCQ